MQSTDTPTFEVHATDYRITIPMSMPENLIEEKMRLFLEGENKIKSPIPGCVIVKIRKVSEECAEKTVFGIMFVLIQVQTLMTDLGKSETDTFYVILKDSEGQNADKCIRTGKPNPYLFYYDGKGNLKVVEKE